MKKTIFLFPAIMSILFSCKKLVEVEGPIDQITSDLVFQDDGTATSAIIGLYNRAMINNSHMLSGAMSIYPSLSSDELTPNTLGVHEEFFANSIGTLNFVVESNIWAGAYSNIFHCHSILEGLEKSSRITLPTRNTLTGEVLFVKALNYFYLVNLFGDVPLVNSADYKENANKPRTAVALIYEQIIGDLRSAETLLSTSSMSTNKTRPDRHAVQALLARVYLYKGDWANAELYAGYVINSGNYSLVANLNGVFASNAAETIWQLMPSATSLNTWEANVFIPSSGSVPNFSLSQSLLDEFDPADYRLGNWVGSTTVNNVPYKYPYKYKVRSGLNVSEYLIVLRLAELYIIRSEARARQQRIAEAISDLNFVRQRAGLSPLAPNISENQCISAIERERRLEFFCEWGHRWFDLKRTNRADIVLTPVKSPAWEPTDALYPIPISQIRKNPALLQNPGY